MPSHSLPAEKQFQIDFNLHWVPAALGLPVPPAAAAAMLDISVDQFAAYGDDIRRSNALAAEALLADSILAGAIDSWPLPRGGTVLFVGDSITTYRYSYARLVEAMLAQRRAADAIRVLNVAQSGYTSTHTLEVVYTQFLAQQPDWVFVKIGVNDCKRFGGPGGKTLVSLDEYQANLAGVVDAFQRFTRARIVLLTPTPVVEAITNSLPDFLPMRMTWSNQDIAACAAAVRSLGQRHGVPVADLMQVFGLRPDPDLFLPDGLHPNPNGHQIVLEHVLRALESLPG